ncbi:MAG: hypothetical protein GFH27_549279n441 [Chloroflexi bacterium AL-W]|nr:hypothetical protein [Chloroflexi bacterium AL-N1]NOK65407.1 hypothetical protein [Chloroflexi bacterium AL-N10]NOK72327.1 hypothetical protein [Chloroflexi bacterium AL-N5]NOK79586.1 hypothetical protein [Chloroflexi bacterium AL-W]NOK87502.1 hypothetical protein [Chloroflexi bacterium AL-N15]
MAEVTLTDYLTLQDGSRRFDGTPNAIDLTFQLPSDFVTGTNLAKPVIQFKYRARQETDLQLWINPDNTGQNVQIDVTFAASNVVRSHHEFLNGSMFVPGAENRIRFILMDHSIFDDENNDIGISDVLLLYQRRVNI